MSHDILPEIRSRRSCREYLPTPVSQDAIQRILDAGCNAPSGANQQPWHMIVVDCPERKQAIRTACEQADRTFHENATATVREWMEDHSITTEKPFLTDAPVLIAVLYDPKAPYSLHSVWIAIAFMLLQATREGLGSLPYTPSAADVKNLLNVPKHLQFAAILPLGVPRESVCQPRKPSSETQSWNRYGGSREPAA
jgi:nitroreductase